jgi:hypothetical protein
LLLIFSDDDNEAPVAGHSPQLLMISDIFSNFHEDTGESDDSNHNGIAVKVFFDQQADAKVLKYVKWC